jgi:hypothetical protein
VLELLLIASLLGQRDTDDAAPTTLSGYQLVAVQRADVSDGKTKVSVEVNSPTPLAGSWPMRIFIDNTQGPAGTVQLSFRGNASGFHSVSRSVVIAAGERREVNLPVHADMRGGTLSASGAGTKGGETSVYFASTYGANRLVLSLGKPEAFEKFVGKPPDYSASGGSAQVQVLSIPPSEAPTELASYSGYDAVVLPEATTLDSLDEAQRRALEGYVVTGGSLVVQGPVRAVKALPLLDLESTTNAPYGFGRVTVHHEGELRAHVLRPVIAVNPRGPVPEYERRYNGGRLEALLPQATAPLGRFLFIIGLFTLAIGPGSLLIARRRGPALLLLTIPLTAIVTCAAIIGYSVVADGFTVHSSVVSLTRLDPKEHRAITVGVSGYYANLAPSSATYSAMTTVVPSHEQNREHASSDMSWRDGLTMGSDFIPSRVYREWGVLTVEPTRARVVIKRGAQPLVQNALGFPITQITVKLDTGVWQARDIADGSEQALIRVASPGDALKAMSTALTERFSNEAVASFTAPLVEGEFLAQVSGQGFLPAGGLKTELHEGQSWVRGAIEP